MKTHIIAMFVLSSATLIQAADLKVQLLGYWAPDTEETLELAKKENREVDFFLEKLMPKMTFEFEQGKMMVHIRGNQAKNPPDLFTFKSVDEESNTLVLKVKNGEAERKATINGDQLTLVWQKQTVVLNRISKEAFTARYTPPPLVADDVTEQDIPTTPAAGSVHGVAFSVEKATLKNGILSLGSMITILIKSEHRPKEFDGKTFLVKPDREIEAPASITVRYMVEGSDLPKTKFYGRGYSMKLEFGAASDGKIPGKVHFRLPGDAGSVAGTFEAELK